MSGRGAAGAGPPEPYRPVDGEARALARRLIDGAGHAALAVADPDAGAPSVARIALATDAEGWPISLVSTLSRHARALEADPRAALLVGEPGDRGDPLAHPRLTLHARARLLAPDAPGHAELRERYLELRPKARLYADFGDFRFAAFDILDGLLNAGFGKAYRLTRGDLERGRAEGG